MEGKKAFILPAVAAVVFGVLLILRSSAGDSVADPDAAAPTGALVDQVRNVIAEASNPKLKPSALSKLQPAIEAAVQGCAPDVDAPTTVKLTVDVAAADGVGSIVEAAGRTALPDAAGDCLHKALGAFEGPDIGQTGRLSTTMQLRLGDTKDASG